MSERHSQVSEQASERRRQASESSGDVPERLQDTLVAKTAESIARHDLLRGVDRLVIGCSGGADSVVLVDVLQRLAAELGIELAVAHLDHAMRGAESARDARLVARLAQGRGLRYLAETVATDDVPTADIEQAMRRQRQAFFLRALESAGAEAVAIGHNTEDRAETVLMNLARGAGPRGLGAMAPRSRVGELLVIRPLLACTRDEIRRYAVARKLEWSEDATNRDPRFTRNRIRAEILPVLEHIVPGAAGNIARSAGLMAEQVQWTAEVVREDLDRLRLAEEYPGGLALDLAGLQARPRALAARLVRAAAREVRGDLRGWSREHVESALRLIGGDGVACDLPGVRLRAEAGYLRVLPLEKRRLAGSERAPGA